MFISAFFVNILLAYAALAVPAVPAELGVRDAAEQQVASIPPATLPGLEHCGVAAAPPHLPRESTAGLVLASPPVS